MCSIFAEAQLLMGRDSAQRSILRDAGIAVPVAIIQNPGMKPGGWR